MNNLNADISFPAGQATVVCGTSVAFTSSVNNGTAPGACDISDLPVTFTCPDPVTGMPTGTETVLATADDFTAVPPSSKTYPAVSCVIGDTSGEVCNCGTANGVYQAELHAGPGILELNPARTDIADITKTVSVQCVTTTTTSTTSTTTSTTSTTSSTTSSTTTSSTTTTLVAQHFQCYETKPQATAPFPVSLVDQFGDVSLSVRRPERLCAPANKNGEKPGAPMDPNHLLGYDLRETRGQFTARRNVQVTNQFGTITIDVTRFGDLLVPASKSLISPPPPLAPDVIDHFLCYTVRHISGTPGFQPIKNVTVGDQFGSTTLDLVRPKFLCNPVDKNGASPGAEQHPTHLLCYQTRFPRERIDMSVFTTDQFGQKNLQLIRRMELCVPSTKQLPG